MSLSAKFAGKCKRCKTQFSAGTQIYNHADHWCSLEPCARETLSQPKRINNMPPTEKKTVTPPANDAAFIRDATVKLFEINQQVTQTLKNMGETVPNGGMVGQFTKIIYAELNKADSK